MVLKQMAGDRGGEDGGGGGLVSARDDMMRETSVTDFKVDAEVRNFSVIVSGYGLLWSPLYLRTYYVFQE